MAPSGQPLFAGLKVIDAASFLAGPGAATILGDFGADVIKIEPPGGDGYRKLVGNREIDHHWLLTSRNKRSVCIDLKQLAGQRLLQDLAAAADVLIVNFRPEQLERFGLTYEALARRNPRLVFAQLSGYGSQGPDADRRALDSTAWWARSGMMEVVRDGAAAPVLGVPGFGDHSTAMAVYAAILTALYKRERTGRGSAVETSLIANGAWANGMLLQGIWADHDLAEIRREQGWQNPFTAVYPSADGRHVIFAITEPGREWLPLLEALDAQALANDERFVDFRSQMRNRLALIDALAAHTARLPLRVLARRLEAQDVTHAVVAKTREVADDPQLRATGVVVPTGSDLPHYQYTVANPLRISGEAQRPPTLAPAVGEHSRAVLEDFGFEAETVATLIADGVIREP